MKSGHCVATTEAVAWRLPFLRATVYNCAQCEFVWDATKPDAAASASSSRSDDQPCCRGVSLSLSLSLSLAETRVDFVTKRGFGRRNVATWKFVCRKHSVSDRER